MDRSSHRPAPTTPHDATDRDDGDADAPTDQQSTEDDEPSAPERVVRWFDRWQADHDIAAYPVAVIRKYADDRGSTYAAILTHYAFVALFPLLVILLTILDRLVDARPGLQARVVDSVIVQLPVIGTRLEEQAQPLTVDGVVVFLSAAALLWGATGFYNSAQLVMSQMWNVEGVDRPGFVGRLLRAIGLFSLLGLGATVSALAWWSGIFVPSPTIGRVTGVLGAAGLSIGLLIVALRIITPTTVPWRRLVAPAVGTGIVWEILQALGQWLVLRRLTGLDDLYGVFALVLVTIAWLNLGARVVVLAVEAAVVAADRLWPRRIAQPPLTEADRAVLERLARNERRRPEEHIEITWDVDASSDTGR